MYKLLHKKNKNKTIHTIEYIVLPPKKNRIHSYIYEEVLENSVTCHRLLYRRSFKYLIECLY